MKKLWNVVKVMTLAFCLVVVGACDKEGCSEGDISTYYTITVQSNDTNKGSVTGTGKYKDGSLVELKATPEEGYEFVSWNDGFKYPVRNVLVESNKTYTATFQDIVEQYAVEKVEIYVEELVISNYPGGQELPKRLEMFAYNLSVTRSDDSIDEIMRSDLYGTAVAVGQGLPMISTNDQITKIRLNENHALIFYADRSDDNKFNEGETVTFDSSLYVGKTSYEIDDNQIKYDNNYDNTVQFENLENEFTFDGAKSVIPFRIAFASGGYQIVMKVYITKI